MFCHRHDQYGDRASAVSRRRRVYGDRYKAMLVPAPAEP
jgi:hypothetical protein